ncbi:MAG: FG-GAP-like repeat-containing protein, partial [Phycisphaerales bacterium]|nr:FG-GAP-like repeat-containing protein [Phycisphaerales bacterium]
YLFAEIDGTWTELARITQQESGVNDGLGVSAAIGDQIWLGRCQNIYELSAPDIYESTEVVSIPSHLWTNEAGGNVNVASNWFPSLPTPGSTATLNMQTRYSVECLNGTLPFDSLKVGPGSPTLSLMFSAPTIAGSIDVAGIGSMYSTLGLYQGWLTANGPVTVADENRPGTINITSSAQLRAMNSYTQNGLGTLSCELNSVGITSLFVEGGLALNGALKLTNDGNYEPLDGRTSYTVLHSDQPPSTDNDRFKISIMPGRDDGQFYKLVYGDEGRGGYTIQIVTEPLPVDGSLSSPDEFGVSGQATDVLVADLFSPEGGLDGYADIALTIDGTPGSLYLFVNDGEGGVSLQTTYPTGNGPTALTAGDMNNDGIDDIIVTNGLDDTVQYWLNPDADATTLAPEAPVNTGSMPMDLIAFDIDSDLDDDIVVTCAGNGSPDPVTGEYYGIVQFFESDGSRALSSKQDLTVNKRPGGISPGDVDKPGDKQDDILISLLAGNQVARLQNPGDDSDWTIGQLIDVGVNPNKIEPLRVGGSIGTVFLVGNEGSDSMSVLSADTTGSLEVIASIDLESTPIGMTTVDMDGDSDRDLAMLVSDPDGNDIRIYRNDTDPLGDGGILLALDEVLLDNGAPILIANGDTDNDGNDDLVSITGSGPGRRSGIETLSVRRSGEIETTCTGDIDGNNQVNVIDLLALIGAWGPCDSCSEDLDENGQVNVMDLLALIAAWGACP